MSTSLLHFYYAVQELGTFAVYIVARLRGKICILIHAELEKSADFQSNLATMSSLSSQGQVSGILCIKTNGLKDAQKS